MAPLDDNASCGGGAIGNHLTTLRKQDTVDRSLHQDKFRPRSDNSLNSLGQTMRSRRQEPSLAFQKAFDAFENQDAALRLVKMVGQNRQQEQDRMSYGRVWAAVVSERPFAGQYAEIDLILQQHADLGPREMKHEPDELVAGRKIHEDVFDIGPSPQHEQQPLSPELSVPTYPPYIQPSLLATTDIAHFQTWGEFAELVPAIFPPGQVPEKWEPALHYLDVYRIAVHDNLRQVRDGAIEMLTAKDIEMPDVNQGLRRGDVKGLGLSRPASLSELSHLLPVQVQPDLLDEVSDEASSLLSLSRDAEAIDSAPKHKSLVARPVAEWETRRIENVSSLSPHGKDATIAESGAETVIRSADFDGLYTARPVTPSLKPRLQYPPCSQLLTPPLDPKITSTAEQLAKVRRGLNKADELKTPSREECTKMYLKLVRYQALQYVRVLLDAPPEQEFVEEIRAILRRIMCPEKDELSAEEFAIARRAVREMGMLAPGEEEAGVGLEELAWTPDTSTRGRSIRKKAAQGEQERCSQAENFPTSKTVRERHIDDLKSQSTSKASGSHQEAGSLVLDVDGSECEAAQESPIEKNAAPAPPSGIIHHSIMFRFLDKLYASTHRKYSQDNDPSQKDHDHERIVLRQPVLRRHALSILKMEDNEELGMLRDRYEIFHEELHSALQAVKQEYEEVAENEHGDWTLRLREGMKLKAKL